METSRTRAESRPLADAVQCEPLPFSSSCTTSSRDGVRRLLGLLVAPLGMEVENLLERVEPLAAIGVLRIEQEETR